MIYLDFTIHFFLLFEFHANMDIFVVLFVSKLLPTPCDEFYSLARGICVSLKYQVFYKTPLLLLFFRLYGGRETVGNFLGARGYSQDSLSLINYFLRQQIGPPLKRFHNEEFFSWNLWVKTCGGSNATMVQTLELLSTSKITIGRVHMYMYACMYLCKYVVYELSCLGSRSKLHI